MNFWHGSLILIGMAVVLTGGCNEEQKPSVVEESSEERDQAISEAYSPSVSGAGTTNVSADPELAKAADDFFTNLGIAFRREDLDKITKLVSAEAMFNLVDRAGLIAIKSPKQRRQMRTAFERGLAQGLSNFAQLMAFDDHDVLRLEEIKEGEMVAYVRLWDDELEIYQKMRWWLLRDREGDWAAYDYEDFDMNLRTSTLLGFILSGEEVTGASWFQPFLKVMQEFQNLSASGALQALPEIEDEVDDLLAHRPPKELEPFIRTLKAGIHLANEEFQEGLEEMDLVEKVDASLPIIHYHRGACHLGLENWDEAIAHFEKYGDVLGWDSDVHEMVADGYYGKGEPEKATRHAEAGLADNPSAWGCIMTLGVSIPSERRGEIKKHVAKTSDPESAYEMVIDHALEMEEREAAREIFAFLKADFPESELIEYYEEEFQKPEAEPAQQTADDR